MKKSAKIIIVIAVVFILIGGIFFGAAYAFGEKIVDMQVNDISKDFTSGDVNRINVNGVVANVRIFKNSGDSGSISIKAENVIESEFKCDISNNSLAISYNPTTVKFGFVSLPSGLLNWSKNTPVINIYIPDGKLFDEVDFTGNVGGVNIEDINSKNFTIDGGVGSFTSDNMTVTGNFSISGRVGNTDIKAAISGNTKIDGGVGSVTLSGQADGDMTINGGVGSITLNLSGDMNEYSFQVSRGLGGVKFNGGDIGDTPSRTTGGKYNIKINGGVGSININIK